MTLHKILTSVNIYVKMDMYLVEVPATSGYWGDAKTLREEKISRPKDVFIYSVPKYYTFKRRKHNEKRTYE